MGKPRIHLHPRSVGEGSAHSDVEQSNLLAMKAKAAKFRTHHVGTKLNEAELHEFEALAEKRKQTPSELIRGVVLGEIERDQQPPRPSVELEEITALRMSATAEPSGGMGGASGGAVRVHTIPKPVGLAQAATRAKSNGDRAEIERGPDVSGLVR